MNDNVTITKEALTWLLRDEESGRVVLLDVREKAEFDRGHLEGAIHLPLGRLAQEVEALVPNKRARVVAYCAKGVRSKEAQAKLAELGYRRALSLAHGYEGWAAPVAAREGLSETEKLRYARQVALPAFGAEGQVALRNARVLVVGLGGLGSPVALYLAAAGVGTLGLVDADEVELSNLQRQILHATPRVGSSKVESARRAVTDLNPTVRAIPHALRFDVEHGLALAAEYDVIVDGSDNFATRNAISDVGCAKGVPVVHGAVHRLEGQCSVFVSERAAQKRTRLTSGPCYRCTFPVAPKDTPNCEEAGVLGSVCGVIGALMATEVLKLLVPSLGAPMIGKLVLYDASACEVRTIAVSRRSSCTCTEV